MLNVRCSCRAKSSKENQRNTAHICCCNWEQKLGYGVAVSLGVFEVKRLFVILLELFLEWQIIQLAGGFISVILSIIGIFLDITCALSTVYTFRKPKTQQWSQRARGFLKYLLFCVPICIFLNILTFISISYNVSVKEQTLADIFNKSMHLYITTNDEKHRIDQIQFNLQCCGHSSYTDWFHLNWQMINDYVYEVGVNADKSVPFSCCSITSKEPCVHAQMLLEDVKTINTNGCSGILSGILLKIVLVAYAMCFMLIINQTFLTICIVRMVKRLSRCPSQVSYCSHLPRSIGCYSQLKSKNLGKRCSRRSRRNNKSKRRESSLESSSGSRAAQIKPSVHVEHRVPQKIVEKNR